MKNTMDETTRRAVEDEGLNDGRLTRDPADRGESAFKKIRPEVNFDNHLHTAFVAMSDLVTGYADHRCVMPQGQLETLD